MWCESMDLNTQLNPIWLIVIVGFIYQLLFLYFFERLRRTFKEIEEEEIIRMLKKKYKKKY